MEGKLWDNQSQFKLNLHSMKHDSPWVGFFKTKNIWQSCPWCQPTEANWLTQPFAHTKGESNFNGVSHQTIKRPSAGQDSNPQPLDHTEYTSLMCYNLWSLQILTFTTKAQFLLYTSSKWLFLYFWKITYHDFLNIFSFIWLNLDRIFAHSAPLMKNEEIKNAA